MPVSRVASAKLGSGWFTRTTIGEIQYIRPEKRTYFYNTAS